MEFKLLLDHAKAQAIVHSLEGTELSVWRALCRSYSEKYATPLHLCLDGTISPEDVLLAVFEGQLDEIDLEKDLEQLLDQIYELGDPDYEKVKRDELKNFMAKAEEEERERIKSGKPIHPAIKKEMSLKNTSEVVEKPKDNMPKGGSVDLSHLAEEEESKSFED